SSGKRNRNPPSQAACLGPPPSGKHLRAVPRLPKPRVLLHASSPTAATRSLSQTGLCAPGTASLPIRSLGLPAGDAKATGQLQEVPWDHRPLDCTLDSMRNDRVFQPPIDGQDQRREPPARSGQSPSALIEAKLNPFRQTHGKTPTEVPCAPLRMPSRFTLVIEIDAWNIRERDNWGKTQALRKAG